MLERATIRQTLVELLEADTGEKYPDLDEATTLREGLGLDSVDVVSIVSQVERRFRIRFTQNELQTLKTVGEVLDLLQEKLAAPPQGLEALSRACAAAAAIPVFALGGVNASNAAALVSEASGISRPVLYDMNKRGELHFELTQPRKKG